MATQPTETFHVTVTARVNNGTPVTRSRDVGIPPEYDTADRRQFFGVILQDTARDLARQQNWGRPVLRALLINAARMRRIEEIVTGDDQELAERIREVILTDDDVALEQWGDGPIEN